MEWIFTRPAVIAIALVGGGFSLAAIYLRKCWQQEQWAARMDFAGYVFMGASMLFFIIAGIRGPES